MKWLLIAIAVICAVAYLVLLFRHFSHTSPRAATAGSPSKFGTLESKLTALAECGLLLSDEFTVDDLLTSWDRGEYEKAGFNLVLVALGMTEEQPPWRPHCRNLWHFDTECIEDDGSYVRIAERMEAMAEASLPLENISDHVDLEKGEAWLRFNCQGREYAISCDVEDDWVDAKVFGHCVELLAKTDPSKVFIYYDLGGQDCIIGCVTRRQFDSLAKLLPKVQPLT